MTQFNTTRSIYHYSSQTVLQHRKAVVSSPKDSCIFFKPSPCHLCLTHMLMIKCLEEDDNTGLVNLLVITDEGFIGIAFIILC